MAKNHFPRAKNGLNEVFKEGIYVEKWSQNFDSGTGSAIFGTPKIATKTPIWGVLGGTENGTLGARIKILRPLFNTNTPPKTPI